MRIRSFTAPDMQDAMAQIRDTLGVDAIILSQERTRGGVKVTAALENTPVAPTSAGRPVAVADLTPEPAFDLVDRLAWHGVPERLAQRLIRTAESLANDPPPMLLAAALDATFRFRPGLGDNPLVLIGPPGAGKTATIAKLAARFQAAGQQPRLITADVLRAGGVEQLQAYAAKLDCPLKIAETPAELKRLVKAAKAGPLLIDMPGLNPFSDEEIDDLRPLLEAADADIAAVLPAGGDADEMAEAGRIFAALGASRLIATKLDGARRYGGLLAAAQAGNLALAEGGISPFVADGLAALSPLGLARLLLAADIPARTQAQSHKRAMP